jgi:hypothetical protein
MQLINFVRMENLPQLNNSNLRFMYGSKPTILKFRTKFIQVVNANIIETHF